MRSDDQLTPAPLLSPEHIKSHRALARMSKEQLIAHCETLQEDVQFEADNASIFARKYMLLEEQTRSLLGGATSHVRKLEQEVKRLRFQIKAVTDFALAQDGNRSGPRTSLAGSSLYVEEGLV